MVSIKEVEYYGLKIRLKPYDEKPFYLTGEETPFKLTVTNLGDKKRYGKLKFIWHYGWGLGHPYTCVVVDLDVKAKETFELIVHKEWHFSEGIVTCALANIGEPEKFANTPSETVKKQPVDEFEALCVYRVVDKGAYNEEMKRYKGLLDEQKAIKEALEKLRADIVRVAREEARNEVLKRLALGLKIAFTQEGAEEKKKREPPYKV